MTRMGKKVQNYVAGLNFLYQDMFHSLAYNHYEVSLDPDSWITSELTEISGRPHF
jgi:hypothetical protein